MQVITRTVKRLQDAGAARTAFRDRTRTIKRAQRVVRQAERIKANSRRAVQHLDDRTGWAIHQGRQKLVTTLRLTRRVMAQTEQRLQGIRSMGLCT